jgi:hypothetical protein
MERDVPTMWSMLRSQFNEECTLDAILGLLVIALWRRVGMFQKASKQGIFHAWFRAAMFEQYDYHVSYRSCFYTARK